MKKINISICLLILAILGHSQTSKEVFSIKAIEKASVSGIRTIKISESDKISTNTKKPSTRNIEIYVGLHSSSSFKPEYIWLEGKAYSVSMEKIQGSVVWTTSGIGNTVQTDTIMGTSFRMVWKLIPQKAFQGKKIKAPAVSKDQLVLVYSKGGKKTVSAPIEIKKLSAAELQ